jgi:hypothetical protein
MSGHPQTKRACESVEDSEMLQDGTQPEFEMGAPPKKKPCGAVEDKTLPLEFELDEDDEYELKREQARLEAMEDMLKLKDNEKIEETIEESEPSQPAKKKVIQTVGVETQSTMELEKVLKKVKKASDGSLDNMSVMMTGP